MTSEIVTRSIGATKPIKYVDLDAFILNICEWYDGVDGQIDISQDERLITMEYVHYNCSDCDSQVILIKDEIPDCVDMNDMILQMEACC